MQIGAMNHPARDVFAEARHFAELGFDFIDLTLEPPAARADTIDIPALQQLLADTGLKVVGHTPFYLPFGSPYQSLRKAAVDEARGCFKVFGQLGVKWVNLHPDGHAPFHDEEFILERNLRSIREMMPDAQEAGVGLMIENTPGRFNSAEQLAPLLDPAPELGLHLDIGHCNLQTEENTADELIHRYASRLRHVHIHDNKGGWGDLHLPLGCGTLDARRYVRALQASGYDGTITLEVFTADPHYLKYSRDQLRRWWDEAAVANGGSRRTAEPARAE